MYEIRTLSNGLKLVLEKLPYVRSISFGVWVKNGSRNETKLTSGISHFIEHMLFKGTTHRSAKDIANEMDTIGGHLNAYTSKDYTCYYTRTLDSHMDCALDILSDMILNPLFDENDIKKECNVIFEEIDMYEDSPEDLVNDLLQELVWKDMPLGSPILGTKESISKFNSKILKDYYYNNYTSQNTLLAIAGNFEIENIVNKVENYFGKWNTNKNYKSNIGISKYMPSSLIREKDIEQVHICLGFPGLSIKSKDIFVLNIFNTLFGDGMSSRLFQSIREEKGLTYCIYSDMYNYIDDGMFTIYASVAPSQSKTVIDLIKNEINIIKKTPFSLKEVNKAKEQIKSNYILGLENTSNRMSALGRAQLLLGYIETCEYVIDKINRVTVEEVFDISNKLFDTSKMSIAAVGKISEIK